MDENENILPIAVTIGEPSGIGPEVVLKAWYKRQEFAISPFFVIGNSNILRTQAEYLNLNIPIKVITEPDAAISSFKDYLPVIEIAADSEFEFKVPNANTAAMVIGAIDKAVEYIMNGEARAMATAPIHKAALYSAGFTSPGHTEYLAALTGKYTGEDYLPVMMLASEELCVVPLTIHMPISEGKSVV